MSSEHFDVVVVGAGIAGAIVTHELTRAGKRVLVLEAGTAQGLTPSGYHSYVEAFHGALARVPNSPYPANPNVPSSSVLDTRPIGAAPAAEGYFVQTGPLPFLSDYARIAGGTSLHWLGTCLRMLPNDFRLQSRYGQGVDWPIGYDDLRPFYERAEWEIGVAGDVADQRLPGVGRDFFGRGYDFPMRQIPPSWLDQCLAHRLKRTRVRMADGHAYPVRVVTTPQGRNSAPRPGYAPVGAVGDPTTGQRCEGNASCVPICPVQAKYNALKTLAKALAQGAELRTQAVASRLLINPESGRITGVEYQRYADPNDPACTTAVARGAIYVLAAHAVENAKLLLASGAANSSGEVGRNLMDHATLVAWALMPEPVGAYRGPGSTSNIPTFRDGPFRRRHAAFIVPIDNWGWNWAAFEPETSIPALVDGQGLFGSGLRRRLGETLPRHMALQFEFEQLPEPTNRVTIDPRYRDRLGNFRPVIRYDLPAYTREAIAVARGVSRQLFRALGIPPVDDHTRYDPSEAGYLTWRGEGYTVRGAGHYMGTHRMGSSRRTSVVNARQRTWDHDNLYLVGCGNMPTVGTSNPTLTMAALAMRAADAIRRSLR